MFLGKFAVFTVGKRFPVLSSLGGYLEYRMGGCETGPVCVAMSCWRKHHYFPLPFCSLAPPRPTLLVLWTDREIPGERPP